MYLRSIKSCGCSSTVEHPPVDSCSFPPKGGLKLFGISVKAKLLKEHANTEGTPRFGSGGAP